MKERFIKKVLHIEITRRNPESPELVAIGLFIFKKLVAVWVFNTYKETLV